MKKNFIYQTIYQLTTMIIPIITIPIIAKAFGSTGMGVWNYIYSIVSYFILFAGLGLSTYGAREIATASDNKEKLSKKFWELELFNLFFVLLVTIAYLFLVGFFFPYKMYFFILSLAVIGVAFDVSWFFVGIADFKHIAYCNTIIKVITFLAILFLVKEKMDFLNYIWIQSISMLLSQLIFLYFIRNKINLTIPSLKEITHHFKPALTFFLAKISTTIFNNLNKTMLGLFSTMSMVGIYSNSLVLVLMSGGILNSLNTVMLPYMSKIYKTKEEKIFLDALSHSLTFQAYLSIGMFFGIVTINNSLIPWFFGSDFLLMKSLVPVLALSIILQAFHGTIAAQYLIPRNEMVIYNKSILTGLSITIIISLCLIPPLGVWGAIISYLLGELMICIIRYKSLIKIGFKNHIGILVYFVLAGCCMFFLTRVITHLMPDTILKTTLQVIIGALIFLAATYNVYLKKFRDIKNQNKSKISKG